MRKIWKNKPKKNRAGKTRKAKQCEFQIKFSSDRN